jgi:hypothetical protein
MLVEAVGHDAALSIEGSECGSCRVSAMMASSNPSKILCLIPNPPVAADGFAPLCGPGAAFMGI